MTANRKRLQAHRALRLKAACSVLALSFVGCATDGSIVGSSTYLQVLDGSRVVLERGSGSTGLVPCPTLQARLVKENPALAGKLRCSNEPARDNLPFFYRARSELGESDEFPAHRAIHRTLSDKTAM